MLVTTSDAGNHSPPVSHLQHVHALPANLRAARHKLGLTLAQVAERSGLPIDWISKVECSRRAPCVENLVRLCLALGVGVDEMLGMVRP